MASIAAPSGGATAAGAGGLSNRFPNSNVNVAASITVDDSGAFPAPTPMESTMMGGQSMAALLANSANNNNNSNAASLRSPLKSPRGFSVVRSTTNQREQVPPLAAQFSPTPTPARGGDFTPHIGWGCCWRWRWRFVLLVASKQRPRREWHLWRRQLFGRCAAPERKRRRLHHSNSSSETLRGQTVVLRGRADQRIAPAKARQQR